MIEVSIPGHKVLRLTHLVMDYNGTLACDGLLLPGVASALEGLLGRIELHVVTADTFGRAQSQLLGIPHHFKKLEPDDQAVAKREYVRALGSEATGCIGNGRNDRMMLAEAALGIVVVQEEGAAVEAVEQADVVCTDILVAIKLLTNTRRLIATLRS
jgi:soluble P-type ATPase